MYYTIQGWIRGRGLGAIKRESERKEMRVTFCQDVLERLQKLMSFQ